MKDLEGFHGWLVEEEKSPLTVEKYLRDVGFFKAWLRGRVLTKSETLDFKAYLVERYAVTSVNSMLSSLNCWLSWLGRGAAGLKF